jgi:hypothetical protein
VGTNSFSGWRLRNVAGAVREDQYAHSAPLGTHKGLHLLCPVCGDGFTVDKSDEETVLAHRAPMGMPA